jgi:hypothetical protein
MPSKKDIVDVAEFYFASRGQHLTNLGKANKTRLNEIYKKYNIDFDAEYLKMNESKLESAKLRKIENDKLDAEYAVEMAERQKLADIYEAKYLKRKVACDKYIAELDAEEVIKNKLIDKVGQDKFISELGNTPYKITESGDICVKGVNFIITSYPKQYSIEDKKIREWLDKPSKIIILPKI